MSNKKNIFLIVGGIFSLLIIALVFVLLLIKPAPEKEFIFSEQEEINISTKTEDISFFNDLEYIKLHFNDDKLTKEFKNIVNVTDNSVLMKNVYLYDVAGDFTINYSDNKFKDAVFTAKEVKSSSDAFLQLKSINSSLANVTKQKEKPITLIINNEETNLENEIQLHQENAKVTVDYKINSTTLTVDMTCGNDSFKINITTK